MMKICDRAPPASGGPRASPVTGLVRSLAVAACAALLLVAASPAFGLSVTVTDPDESGITIQGYDIKSLELDDSSTTDLDIEFRTYGDPLLAADDVTQLQYHLYLDVHGFDQDTGTSDPVTRTLAWDFRIVWYGAPAPGVAYTYDNQTVLYGQDGNVIWNEASANATTPSNDTLTLLVPWADLDQKSTNTDAFPGKTIYPPGISFWGGVDNGQGQPDDYVPDTGFIVVPEPLTVLGVFGGIIGIGAYIRRRILA